MRELAKTTFGFSMAMSLFGIQQLRSLAEKDEESNERTKALRDDLDSIIKATDERFNEQTRELFESGDRFQREVTDYVFDLFDSDIWKPKKVLEVAADLADKSADLLRETVDSEDSKTKAKEEPQGGRKTKPAH